MAESIDVTHLPPLTFAEAMALQTVELNRAVELLRSLEPADWEAQTDCPDWDVRRMYLHVLGASEAGASLRVNAAQMLRALQHRRKEGGSLEGALSGLQVRERIDLAPDEVVERLAAVAPRTVYARTRLPRLARLAKAKVDAPVVEWWSLGYLAGTIYLRDLWMHRVDACRATGREMELTPDHDGRIVADIVAEWVARHGREIDLTLTGPAGGHFISHSHGGGDDLGPLELDAVEMCRILAGRAKPPAGSSAAVVDAFETIVPF